MLNSFSNESIRQVRGVIYSYEKPHKDIEQIFSKTSELLKSYKALTLHDLHEEIHTVYKEGTTVTHMDNMANWVRLYMKESIVRHVQNFSQYRYFLFLRSSPLYKRANQVLNAMLKPCKDDWRSLRIVNGVCRGVL